MSTYLLSIEALDPNDNPVKLRFATGYYASPEAVLWEPRIQQPGLYRAGLYAGDILGSTRSGYGETTLINTDGALDYLADYAVDGREAVLYLAENGSITEQMRGTVSRLGFERSTVSVKLRDPIEPLQQTHPQETYAGDNVLPDGLEGTEDDVAGRVKPRLYGQVCNASPVLVNSARLIYQISDRACAISGVYDRGAELANGGDYLSMDDLQSVEPAAGEWRSYQGYLRLGDSPAGTITVDASTANAGAGSVMQQVVADANSGYELHPADVAPLNALGAVRLWVSDETTTAQLLDSVAVSVGGYWRINAAGELRASLWGSPGEPDTHLYDHQMISVTRSATGGGGNGLPVWRVTLRADRLEVTQQDVAGSVPAERRARLSSEYRSAIAKSDAVRGRHPLADELRIDSRLSDLGAAQDRANAILALLGSRRDIVEVVAMLGEAEPASIGATVRVITPRLGYSLGRDMRVIGRTFDAARRRITLNLWG